MNVNLLWGNCSEIPAENKWRLVRQYRNELLSKCDWTQIADAPLSVEQKMAWQVYRQALRDLPEQLSNPEDVVFPEAPQ